MRNVMKVILALVLVYVLAMPVQAGINDRFSDIELGSSVNTQNVIIFPQISAPTGNPVNNYGWLYVKDSGGTTVLYFEDDAGTVTDLVTAGATAWDDISNPDANKTISFAGYSTVLSGTTTTGDQFTIQGTGNFGDVSILKVQQITGNPTDGTVLEVISADADADALIVTANAATRIQVAGSGDVTITGLTGAIDYTDFDVSADGAVTLACDDGGDMITLTPSAAAVGINASNATITNALVVGANAIVGTTGIIDYTNFDVDAAGGITATSIAVGTWYTDAVVAATAATTLTLDGTGVGGVSIGTTSTGTITLGGGATLVNLPSTVDLVLAGGDITASDTANADMVTFTNNTMTTADLLTLSATGTRTSDNVIEIVDGATTATTIGITANTQAAGHGISYTNTGAALTGAALYMGITDGAGFTGYYIHAYDGAATDFSVRRYGATVIGGLASTNMLTVTTGDVQLDDGKLEVDTDEDDTSHFIRNQGATTGPVVEIEETAAAADNAALLIDQNATAAASYGLEIDTAGGTAVLLSLEAAAGDGISFSTPAAYTGQLIAVNDTLVGTTGEGLIDIKTTANLADGATLVRLDFDTGTMAGAHDGFMLSIDDDSVNVGTSYAVLIDSASNEALHVAHGVSLFAEAATFTAGIVSNGELDINFSVNTEEMDINSGATDYAAGSGIMTIYQSGAGGSTNASYLMRLAYLANGDAQDNFILCEDNSNGTAGNGDDKFKVDSEGTITMGGGATGTGGAFIYSFENLTVESGGTAASIVQVVSFITTNGDGDEDAVTLADGTVGQVKIFVTAVEGAGGDSYKITPAHMNGGTKITFDAVVGDGCTFIFDGTSWNIIGNNGGTIS